MTDQPTQNDRIDRLEVDMLDVKVSLNRLIDYSFESDRRLTNSIDRLAGVIQQLAESQAEVLARMDEMQSEVRGLQTENRRILERWEQHTSDGHGG